MRGKLKKGVLSLGETRITPADAGKTPKVSGNITGTADHPRGCGENLCGTCAGKKEAGSPPRMRGKHYETAEYAVLQRITPADAGKT